MRIVKVLGLAVLSSLPLAAAAEDAFDACDVFTVKEAEAALGTSVVEASNFKGKRPKVVMTCQYAGFKEGKAVTASAQFKFARTEADMRQAFADSRLELQTKPILVEGNEAFWAGKSGQLYVRKGRAQVTVVAGPVKENERDMDVARKLAETLVKKL
jgi:hypothetical protein